MTTPLPLITPHEKRLLNRLTFWLNWYNEMDEYDHRKLLSADFEGATQGTWVVSNLKRLCASFVGVEPIFLPDTLFEGDRKPNSEEMVKVHLRKKKK